MSLKQLPQMKTDYGLPQSLSFDMRPEAAKRWQGDVRAKSEGEGDNVITMYDQIGESWYSEGVTAKRIAAALRRIGDGDVVVNINSPGGDYFEGISIYNLLAQHPGKVTVQIVGLAASAASVIAMAGDEILMANGTFLMIHNAWSFAIGNRHDLQASIEILTQIDDAMADLYAAQCGLSKAEIVGLMDGESWIGKAKALEYGFATGALDNKQIEQSGDNDQKQALALIESSLAQQGMSRAQRRDVFQNLFHSKPGAAVNPEAKPRAGANVAQSFQSLMNTLKGEA